MPIFESLKCHIDIFIIRYAFGQLDTGLVFAYVGFVYIAKHMGSVKSEKFNGTQARHVTAVQQCAGCTRPKRIFYHITGEPRLRVRETLIYECEHSCLKLNLYSKYCSKFCWKEQAERISHWSRSHSKPYCHYLYDHWFRAISAKIWCPCFWCTFYQRLP